ncbi:MAG: hypothetical protein COS92_01740 [Desulfobacterales bacterium CG07_land_8_20_14_0_80_52_14]|nr:MAG: hypothetical protein COX20_05215 [Desulfobacterales bacterium CG23_combo_of_CG06-09_8_20_14_all_52_9]PIU50371.1 MAG: hypothetical protein COS92_01740 [Desulfobacterales bacterium CG07_land_8_20_14_0_80_52_14]
MSSLSFHLFFSTYVIPRCIDHPSKRNTKQPFSINTWHSIKFDEIVKTQDWDGKAKKLQMQGAQILRNEAYLLVRRNDEGCSATQQMDFLRSHQI